MDGLKRSDLLQHLTGQVFLCQHDALTSLDPQAAAHAEMLMREA